MSHKKTKVFLIVPPVIYARQPFIGIAYLLSYLKYNGYETKAWDLNTEILIENDGDDDFWNQEKNCSEMFFKNKELFNSWVDKILDFDPQIVGFVTWGTSVYFSLQMAKIIKEKCNNIKIVLGGYYCSIEGEKLIQNKNVDAVVIGEGEETLLEIVNGYSKGKVEYCKGAILKNDNKIINCGLRAEIKNIDLIPFPDFSDFCLDRYLFKYHIPLVFSRGCSWCCKFCTVYHCWKSLRCRTAENIYQEILLRLKQYPMLKQFELCDCAFNQDLELISKLCDMIIKDGLNIRFSGLAKINPKMDIELLRKMRKAGFVLCNYGVESGSEKVLRSMGKNYTPEEAERVIRDTYNAGINVVLNFIVGYPNETEKDFYETLRFIERIKDYVTNIAPGHECSIDHNFIEANPELFNVVFPKENISLWRTKDGLNTHEERMRRVKIFNDFVTSLKIPLRCGADDRRAMMSISQNI